MIKFIGVLLLPLIFILTILFSFYMVKLWIKAYDQILKDISDAVNGRYKSKYKRR